MESRNSFDGLDPRAVATIRHHAGRLARGRSLPGPGRTAMSEAATSDSARTDESAQAAQDTQAAVTTTVHLLRHGEVDNPAGILYGRLPGYHLSELGRQMAERIAKTVAGRDITVRKDGRPMSAEDKARLWQLWYRERQDQATYRR